MQSSEPTETDVGGKRESLQQQFASLYLPLSPSLPQLLTSWGIISEAFTLICLQVSSQIKALNTWFIAYS